MRNHTVLQFYCIKIDLYGFFEADTDILAVHGLIADISKILNFGFLLHYQKYDVFCALPFFQKLKKTEFMS